MQAFVKLAAVRNVETSPEQMTLVLSYLEGDGWTVEDFEAACRLIARDPQLARQVGYNGMLTPDVFTEAREKGRAAVDLGKCFTPYCNNRATVEAWGDAYCAGCYEGHKIRSDAYQDKLDESMVQYGLRAPEDTRRHRALSEPHKAPAALLPFIRRDA